MLHYAILENSLNGLIFKDNWWKQAQPVAMMLAAEEVLVCVVINLPPAILAGLALSQVQERKIYITAKQCSVKFDTFSAWELNNKL